MPRTNEISVYLRAALWYAQKRGWRVFPCRRGAKIPMPRSRGFKDASTDVNEIEEWWREQPEANIGIPTGNVSGFFVLDVDGDEGRESLWRLEREHGELPETVRSKTGGGGEHILFTYPGVEVPCSAGKIAQGLDVRGDGGYIIVPPSESERGKYSWQSDFDPRDVEIVPGPDWLLKLVVKPISQRSGPGADLHINGTIPKGERNARLMSLAGTMRHRAMEEEEIYAAITAVNSNRCVPPLEENEVQAIARSAVRYEPGEQNAIENEESVEPTALSTLNIDEIFALDLPDDDSILGDRLLAKGEALAVFGPSAVGKSRWVLQLSIDSILGMDCCGLETHGKGLSWLFFQVENSARRLKWDLGHMLKGIGQAEREAVVQSLRILTPLRDEDRQVSLDDPAAVGRLTAAVIKHRPNVVVFDPMIEFYIGDDENAARPMRATYRALMKIAKSGDPDAAVIIIHHSRSGRAAYLGATGYDRTSYGRGSKALHGCVRGAINMAPGLPDSNEVVVLACGKASNGPEFERRAIRLDPESMTYEEEHGFDFDRWDRELSGKPEKGGREEIAPDVVAMILKEKAEPVDYAALVELVKATVGVGKRKAKGIISEAVKEGLVTQTKKGQQTFYTVAEAPIEPEMEGGL